MSGVSVIIEGDGRPFGVLGLHSKSQRVFVQEDVNFLQSVANVLASAVATEKASASLLEKREQLAALSRKLIEAHEAERRAVARELHDDFGQILTAIRTNLQRASVLPAVGRESVELIDSAIGRLRELAIDLRPPVLDDLGLAAALRWHVARESARTGLAFEVDVDFERRLPPEVEIACFRIVQEALTNVVRHSGATRVSVSLKIVDDTIDLIVQDDGRGFDVAAARRQAATGVSQGVLTMEERAMLAGGRMSIKSSADRGTTVQVLLPTSAGADR